jgi:quinol-cytochrome oxidoreductase complex cytochrome b subunit
MTDDHITDADDEVTPAVREDGQAAGPECFDPLDQSAEHHKEWGDQPTIKFFPYHVTAEITNVFLLLCVYLLLAVVWPAGLETRANPLITPEGIKPEWYFLFLYAFMHYVPPVVGTLAPLVGLALLAALPWIDRNPERAPRKRKFAIAGSILVLVGIVVLSIIGIME